ncbi:MAG: hypothetical protein J0L97_09640 [Alphaproteobacteria bacterium]|nr:hypothetical protein [Alphaproteobacteria bacterium]
MSRKDENGIVNFFVTGWRLVSHLVIPALIGGLAMTTVFYGLPEAMEKFSRGMPLDLAISTAYSEYYESVMKMYQPGGKFKFATISPAILGGIIGGFLYVIFAGKFWKRRY